MYRHDATLFPTLRFLLRGPAMGRGLSAGVIAARSPSPQVGFVQQVYKAARLSATETGLFPESALGRALARASGFVLCVH